MQSIYIASDHAGYELKEKVREYLLNNYSNKYKVIDCGAEEYLGSDDYPDYIHKAGSKLQEDVNNNVSSLAFVFGGSGQGEAMVMNRYSKIRCTTYYSVNLDIIKLGRMHNNANSISFGARFVSYEECVEAIRLFLLTDFEGERHEQRVKSISI